ncbi:MAG TPA: helix-turn-helix transcriptional regulator [Micromonosporaceae bacterium]|nr:helix-turn-helix transcriptional regulator [Micromonosporaceae bacterium]
MVLLRRVIGDALRARRQGQHRTLREVSTAANVSLGYLSEVERGQKEASSELLAAICDALGAQLSEVLREASDTIALAEQMSDVLPPATERPAVEPVRQRPGTRPLVDAGARRPDRQSEAPSSSNSDKMAIDGSVRVSVRQDSPFKATLRTARRVSPPQHDRDVVCVA